MERKSHAFARRAVLVIGVLIALAGMYILTQPVDANDFEETTGVAWVAFQSDNPEPAGYLAREARLLGVSFAFLGVAAAAIAATYLKRGDRTGWGIMWFLPLAMAGVAAVFLTADAAALGSTYAVVAIVAGLDIAIGQRAASN